MKKVLTKISKILGYFFVYVICTLGTAVGVLFLSPTGGKGGGLGDDSSEIKIAPQISSIYNNFSTVNALSVNLDVAVETPASSILIGVNASLNLENGLDNLSTEGSITIDTGSEQIPIDFKYTDGVIFIDVLNGKFYIETNSVMDSLTTLMQLLEVELPDLGSMFGSLDINSILGLLSNLTEVKGKDSITLTITIPVINEQLEVVCDLNYSIKSLSLPKTTIAEGTTIALASQINYPNSVTVVPPTETEYINATHLFSVASGILQTLNEDAIGLNINAKYDGMEFSGSLNADMKDFAAQIQVDLFDRPLSVIAKDNTLYADYQNAAFKFAYSDAGKLQDFIEKLGVNVPLTQIAALLSSFKDGNLMEIIPSLDFGGSSSNGEIDLSILESFTKEDNLYTITINDIGTISIGFNEAGALDSLAFVGLGAEVSMTTTTPKPVNLSNVTYLDVVQLLPAAEAALNTFHSNNYFGSATILYGETEIVADYALSLSPLRAHIGLSAFEQNISVDIDGNAIYAEYQGLKLSAQMGDIDKISQFVQQVLGVEQKEETNLLDTIFDILNPEINPALIKQLETTETGLKVVLFNDLAVSLDYSEKVTGVGISMDALKLNASINAADKLNFNEINANDYTPIVSLLPYVSIIKNYVTESGKQFDISAKATVYDKETAIYQTNNISLQLDLTDKFKFYADAVVSGIAGTKSEGFNLALNAALQYDEATNQDYLYVNYNGLCVKMQSGDLEEIIALIMQMLGMDSGVIPSSEMDLNPLTIIKMFNSVKVYGNTLEIGLDGSQISSDERAKNMKLRIITDGEKLIGLDILGIYTGVTNEEHFDLQLSFNDYTEMTKVDQINNYYIDISGSNNLIKAVANTATLTDFEINGKINLEVSVPILNNIVRDIPINAKIKMVNGKPKVMVKMGLPVIHLSVYNLNNDTSFGTTNTIFNYNTVDKRERTAYIYYDDGYCYFYRTEHDGDKTYEKKLKAPLETVMDDVLYYVQYVTGFSDDIINAIRESLSKEHTIDMSRIFTRKDDKHATDGFVVSDNGMKYNITLDMGNISGDDMMGDMSIGLNVTNKNDKNYIGSINFGINMPFMDSIQLDMVSDDLLISNLDDAIAGKELDFTELDNFVTNYSYAENVEWDAYSGNWQQAAERTFTVNFDSGVSSETFTSVTGKQGETFTLPTFSQSTLETSTSTERDIYNFEGWYSSNDFNEKNKVTEGIIARKNVTLYAKWTPSLQYRTVHFYNGDTLITSQYDLVSTALMNVDIPLYIEKVDGLKLHKLKFAGWVDKNNNPITKIPTYTCNLYASYEEYETLTQYNLHIENGVGAEIPDRLIYNTTDLTKIFEGFDTNDVAINKDGITTTYTFAGWFKDENLEIPFDFLMPNGDITVYAKWDIVSQVYERQFNIYDNGELVYNGLIEEGTEITLPDTLKIDENTKWYLDDSYTQETTLPSVMPNEDVNLYIRNKYEITYVYYAYENGKHTQKTSTASLYQGEALNLPTQNPYEFDVYENGELSKRMYYTFNGYSANRDYQNNIMPNGNITLTSNVKEDYKNYYTISFDISWQRPSGWWGDGTCLQSPNAIPSIKVLDGDTIDPSIYTATSQWKYLGTKNVKVVAWNTTGCKMVTDGLTTHKNYDKLTSLTVTGNTTLYAVWDMV